MALQDIAAVVTLASYLGISLTLAALFLITIAVWTLVWKGLALWKSSKKEHLAWFIVLLIVNTAGILEILYIYVFSKMGKRKPRPINHSTKVKHKKK
jgi:hypothetical protein